MCCEPCKPCLFDTVKIQSVTDNKGFFYRGFGRAGGVGGRITSLGKQRLLSLPKLYYSKMPIEQRR